MYHIAICNSFLCVCVSAAAAHYKFFFTFLPILYCRCDLVVVVNGRKEKIASGLLNPFVAHLKAAQDQIAKGGYTILLQPDLKVSAPWFT